MDACHDDDEDGNDLYSLPGKLRMLKRQCPKKLCTQFLQVRTGTAEMFYSFGIDSIKNYLNF